jgi:16S rRNA (guanine(527)-N(7))-methyltransferase RsmG
MFHVKHSLEIENYITCLKEYNEHTNIFSKTAYDKLPFHIQDSINIANIITNSNLNVIDIGSGSGLPAVFIALFNEKNTVYAVESKSRKTEFLDKIKDELRLRNLFVINENIRDFLATTRQKIDFFTAKAFGPYSKINSIVDKPKFRNSKTIVPISVSQFDALDTNEKINCKKILVNSCQYYYLIM